MDSPESRQIAASTSSSSLAVQESSFSSYVSSLSPIKPVRLLHFSNFLSRSSAGSTSPDIVLSQVESFPRRREDAESLDELGQSNTQFNVGSVPCPEEEVQCTSVCLSGEVADTVMVDSLSSPDIPLKAASNPHEVLKSPLTNSQESIIVVGDAAKHTETEANVALASSKEAHDELFAEITYIPSRSVMDLVDSDSDLVQNCQQFMALNGGINQHDWDCIPLASFGLMNNANMSEMLDKVSRPTKGFEEASQFQGGTGRQLEFEAAMACRDVATDNHYRKTEGINMDNSRSPFTPISLESHISFLKEIGGHSSSVLQVSHVPSNILQLPLCANKTFQGCSGGNGIHLDSIGETVTTCSNAITDIKSSGCLKPHPVDIKPIKQCTKLIEEKISVSEDAQRIVDQHQMTFRKKRKPAMQNIESEGCKHCSCKKSKCLKLYCECFAAGVYCAADTCTCENCFNKEEYEDTVLDIRQQIESRNPLAFTPKIVKQVPEPSSSISDQGIHMAPSSARHKRGCYCKKSKCLKKYCECNQAKVGCSNGCRCEDCQNTFGPKPACISAEGSEGPPKEKLGSVDTGTYIVDNSQFPGNAVREMVSTEQELNCSKPGREYESMPSWEVFADLNHFTAISDPPSEFSHLVSPNAMNLTEGPLSQETNPHSSDGSLHCLSLPISFTPQLCKTKDLSELGYYTPNEAICTSIPIEDENKVPLNLKGRPPQFYQVQEPMSSSLLAEKSACNFLLQPAPSFPNFILHGDPKKEQFNQK